MGLFNLKKQKTSAAAPIQAATPSPGANGTNGDLASLVLSIINDGVVMTDRAGAVQFMNPAAARLCGLSSPNDAVGLDSILIIRIETKEGRELSEAENPFIQAIRNGQTLKPYECSLIVGQTDKRIPISISVLPSGETGNSRVITFRDITEELKEEGEQMEFISTASHEMRTPVATIDGYLALCLNPQTATIDERARNYLSAAHAASQHLGKLFQDLLDVTKLDDSRIRPSLIPVEMIELVRDITNDYIPRANEKKINLTFGADDSASVNSERKLSQVVYSYVDTDFMREILDNLIDNALKYTPSGGSIYINVRGDGDRVLINVTDTGMGISSDDLGHIFQKFYRADNSDTRTIGGTGLGLYLVKQRTEAMGGQVWAESAFGEGSTFYVSLPRLTADEYEKRMIPIRNQKMQEQLNSLQTAFPAQSAPVMPQPVASMPQPNPNPSQPMPQSPAPMAPQPMASMPQPTQPAPQPMTTAGPQPAVSSSQPASQAPFSAISQSIPQQFSQPTVQQVPPQSPKSFAPQQPSQSAVSQPSPQLPPVPLNPQAAQISPPQMNPNINNNLNGENI